MRALGSLIRDSDRWILLLILSLAAWKRAAIFNDWTECDDEASAFGVQLRLILDGLRMKDLLWSSLFRGFDDLVGYEKDVRGLGNCCGKKPGNLAVSFGLEVVEMTGSHYCL